MHRPCLALGIFFSAFAGSLFFVSPSHAQWGLTFASVLPSPAVAPSSQAQNYDWLPAETGYDSAYDSAMFDGQYLNDGSYSTCEPATDTATTGNSVTDYEGPGTSVQFDDWNCCVNANDWSARPKCSPAGTMDTVDAEDAEVDPADVDAGFESVSSESGSDETGDVETGDVEFGDVASGNDDWEGVESGEWETVESEAAQSGTTEDGEADGQVGASALTVDQRVIETSSALLWQAFTTTLNETADLAQVYWHSSSPSIVWQRSDMQQVVLSIREAVDQTWETAVAPTYAEQTYSEEIVMLQVANTLDQIGMQLQEAAHFIRFKAADRIVSKGQRRRVANR